jgi:NAD(P)-dependent dehydrogenase (short-subunit alcohol dehydrogenase family)
MKSCLALPEMLSLKGRLALVTGGSQNFGLEIATGLAEMGADIIITSRQLEKAERVAAELAADLHVSVTGLALDLRDEASIIAAFKAIQDRFGRLDILVNNAGGHSPGVTGNLLTESLTAWNNFVDANLTGTFLCVREAAKLMQAVGKGGSIVNIGSVTSMLGRDRSVYAGTTMIPNM